MLKLPFIALFLRTIPEGILLIISSYLLTGKEINVRRIIFCGLLLGLSTYLIRLLPIHFGVHTVIIIMIFIYLSVKINEIEFLKAVTSSITCTIILFVIDWISILMYLNIFHIPPELIFNNSITNLLMGLPFLVLGFLIVFLVIFIKKHKSTKKVA